MGIFDLKGGSSAWNYSDPNKAGYAEQVQGTVVEISNPQARDFSTGKPAFWDDGNPKRNLCVTIQKADGKDVQWIFTPRSKAAEACLKALDPDGTRAEVSIQELLGKLVTVATKAGAYNAQHPRPWAVRVDGQGTGAVRGLVDLSAPQAQQAPAPAQAPAAGGEEIPEIYTDDDIPF